MKNGDYRIAGIGSASELRRELEARFDAFNDNTPTDIETACDLLDEDPRAAASAVGALVSAPDDLPPLPPARHRGYRPHRMSRTQSLKDFYGQEVTQRRQQWRLGRRRF